MLVAMIAPNGETRPCPPAYGTPPCASVWQPAQSLAFAMYSPRASVAASAALAADCAEATAGCEAGTALDAADADASSLRAPRIATAATAIATATVHAASAA